VGSRSATLYDKSLPATTTWISQIQLGDVREGDAEDGGNSRQTNFDTYMRAGGCPSAEVANQRHRQWRESPGSASPAVTVVAPALPMRSSSACGARVVRLPITAEAVKAT